MQKIMFNDRYGLTQAVLEGRKTMTRRVMKPQPDKIRSIVQDIAKHPGYEISSHIWVPAPSYHFLMSENRSIYPDYQIGEIVAVAQSYRDAGIAPDMGGLNPKPGWSNKMFTKAELMPHQIRITSVRSERLQDISEEDCMKEGIKVEYAPNGRASYYFFDNKRFREKWFDTPREAFSVLIDKVSGRGTWQSNPWVWVYEFELIK